MKHTKRLLAILIAALILAVSAAPALAAAPYTAVSPSITGVGLGLKEKLEVTEPGAQNPQVTYTLTLGDAVVYQKGTPSVTYGDLTSIDDTKLAAVNGKRLATVTFNAGEILGKATGEKEYTVDANIVAAINALEFDRPGIYYWPIEKTTSSTDSKLTNYNKSSVSQTGTALAIRVDDNGSGVLEVTAKIAVRTADGLPDGNKDAVYEDNYPSKPGTLTLKKEVTGNQGARDQYFKFEVTLTGMTDFASTGKIKVDVDEGNSVAALTADDVKYGEAITAGTTTNAYGDTDGNVTIDADGKVELTFWLKDGEAISLENIPVGSSATAQYQIVESGNDGYTVSYSAVTGTVKEEGDSSDTGARALSDTDSTGVVFKNDKKTSTPTGITLQMAAPLFGIVLAGLLMAVVLFSKRRENH